MAKPINLEFESELPLQCLVRGSASESFVQPVDLVEKAFELLGSQRRAKLTGEPVNFNPYCRREPVAIVEVDLTRVFVTGHDDLDVAAGSPRSNGHHPRHTTASIR